VAAVRELAQGEFKANAQRYMDGSFPWENMRKLAEIGAELGRSPVYLTQLFQQIEGVPLYRYHLRLRLARALEQLPYHEDLAALALELGFSSHAHFTSSFRQAYGRTPSEFRHAAAS